MTHLTGDARKRQSETNDGKLDIFPIIRDNPPELRHEAGELDEFIAENVRSLHLEQMGHAQWWIGVELSNGDYWHINIGAKNNHVHGYGHAFFDHNTGAPHE